jgi:hypothetical protein
MGRRGDIMELFKDELIKEFMEWKHANPDNFTWWNFVNMKYDFEAALAFAKFFYPEVIEVDGCFLLKDKFSQEIFDGWKKGCENDKTCIEKMMNLYEVKDLFHINATGDEHEGEQIIALGNILKIFWTMSFKDRYPDRPIIVDVFMEYDNDLFITVFEEVSR